MWAASITQARVFDLSHTAGKRQQQCGHLLLLAMIQNFHVTLSHTNAQKCLHCFPGKKSLLLHSITWRQGRHSRHGALHLWKKGGKKTVVFGGNSDLVSLESQTNWERKIWSLSLGCTVWFWKWGDFWSLGTNEKHDQLKHQCRVSWRRRGTR